MSGNRPPLPPLPPPPPPRPPAPGRHADRSPRRHLLRNVLLIAVVVLLLLTAAVLAVIVKVAEEVDHAGQAKKKEPTASDASEQPLTIFEGKAFTVRGFEFAAGWNIRRGPERVAVVKKLSVTNNRSEEESAFVEIKVWKGTEVKALIDCITAPIEVGATVKLACSSTDRLPRNYDKVTIRDAS